MLLTPISLKNYFFGNKNLLKGEMRGVNMGVTIERIELKLSHQLRV